MQNNLLQISKLVFTFSFFAFAYADEPVATEQVAPPELSTATQGLTEIIQNQEEIVTTEFAVPTTEQETIELEETTPEEEVINAEVINDEATENNVSLYLEDLPANNNVTVDCADGLSNVGLILLASLKKTFKKPKLCSTIYEKIWKGDKKYRVFMLALITKLALKVAEKGFKKDISGKTNTMLNYFLAMMCATALAESESCPSLQDFLA